MFQNQNSFYFCLDQSASNHGCSLDISYQTADLSVDLIFQWISYLPLGRQTIQVCLGLIIFLDPGKQSTKIKKVISKLGQITFQMYLSLNYSSPFLCIADTSSQRSRVNSSQRHSFTIKTSPDHQSALKIDYLFFFLIFASNVISLEIILGHEITSYPKLYYFLPIT